MYSVLIAILTFLYTLPCCVVNCYIYTCRFFCILFVCARLCAIIYVQKQLFVYLWTDENLADVQRPVIERSSKEGD